MDAASTSPWPTWTSRGSQRRTEGTPSHRSRPHGHSSRELKAPIYSERLRALAAELGCAEHDTTLAGHLTAREKEVLILIAEGLSNKEIAERLVISQGTAIRHVANIFAKIGVNNRTAAARAALDRGLV